jgi:hypothetical protein
MEREEFDKVIERLQLEFRELEALRTAADTLRVFRAKLLFVDTRFD